MSQGNQRGSGEILEPIPTDLINEIFSRLPAKSAVRFRFLSRLWGSMLHRPYFNELFLTNSLARPRLLLAVVERYNKYCSFFSLPQLQSPCEKSSSLVVAADFHIKFPRGKMTILYSSDLKHFSYGYASGLIYFSDMWPTKKDFVPVICNPITGQYAMLPKLWRYRKSFSFLGFDPIDKQVKVLFVAYPGCSDDNRILTFRTGRMTWRSWRKIECPLRHEPLSNGICINGVLYYLAEDYPGFVIACFDVRSEKFMFVNFNGFEHYGGTECNYSESNCPCGPCSCGKTVINYKGKLCVICWKTISDEAMEFRMWVLEDIDRQDLSEYVYTLPVSEFGHEDVSVVGMTARGEIVFHDNHYVCYFNPERNTLQTVEIQGLGNGGTVLVFMDHVEDLNVIDGKLLKFKSSIFEEQGNI